MEKIDFMKSEYYRNRELSWLSFDERVLGEARDKVQYKISICRGRKVRALVPVIRNLVFVHARPSEVQRFKSQITYLQYITDTRSGQKIIIPDHDMQRFIAVA